MPSQYKQLPIIVYILYCHSWYSRAMTGESANAKYTLLCDGSNNNELIIIKSYVTIKLVTIQLFKILLFIYMMKAY